MAFFFFFSIMISFCDADAVSEGNIELASLVLAPPDEGSKESLAFGSFSAKQDENGELDYESS